MSVSMSEEELEAMPLGAVVYDRDGDELTRVEGGWRYTQAIESDGYFGDYVSTSMETAREFTPVTLHRPPSDRQAEKILAELMGLWLELTPEEQTLARQIIIETYGEGTN